MLSYKGLTGNLKKIRKLFNHESLMLNISKIKMYVRTGRAIIQFYNSSYVVSLIMLWDGIFFNNRYFPFNSSSILLYIDWSRAGLCQSSRRPFAATGPFLQPEALSFRPTLKRWEFIFSCHACGFHISTDKCNKNKSRTCFNTTNFLHRTFSL